MKLGSEQKFWWASICVPFSVDFLKEHFFSRYKLARGKPDRLFDTCVSSTARLRSPDRFRYLTLQIAPYNKRI
jgi:hypothetical protein